MWEVSHAWGACMCLEGVKKKFIGQGGFSKQGGYLHPTTQEIIGLSLHAMFSTALARNCFFLILMQFLATFPNLTPQVQGLNFKHYSRKI